MEKKKAICVIAFSIYILIVLKLTVFRFNIRYEESQLNLTLFITLINIYKHQGIGEFLWLFLGNIVWFVPLGFFLPILLKKRSFLIIMIIGFLFSFAIETTQYVFRKGVAELDDLILNTLGVAIGYCLFKMVVRFNNLTLCKKSKGSF